MPGIKTISTGIAVFLAASVALAEPLDTPIDTPNYSTHEVARAASPFLPTFGRLHWADVSLYGGFRIQENVMTGAYRLIDSDGAEIAEGSLEICETALREYRADARHGFKQKHIVLLVHGLLGSPGMFDSMKDALKKAGFEAYALRYPSTQGDLQSHAARLRRLLQTLDGIERVSVVTQSMGALVIRKTLGEDWNPNAAPALDRIVLVGPPSNGSAIADVAHHLYVARWIGGPAVKELTTDAVKRLPHLPVPFAIIAGGRGTSTGYNPLLSGDDDGLVTVDEAFVSRAHDFLRIDTVHGLIVSNEIAIEAVIRYLKTGHFRAGLSP